MSVSKKILGRDRQLINKIKKHFETYGGISVVDFPEYEEVEKSIGWNEALDIAMEELKRKKLTKEEIIEEIQKEYQKNGQVTHKNFKYGSQAIKLFGSWNNAVEMALGKSKVRVSYTREEIIEKIREQYNKNGKVTKDTFKHTQYVRKYFGSWENAMIEVLGFVNKINNYTKEDITERMREHYKKYGEIRAKEFKHSHLAIRSFGSWLKALKAAGIRQNRYVLTKEEVIEAIKREYQEKGVVNRRKFPHISQIKKYYRSWSHATEEVLGINNFPQYTKEEVIDLMKNHYRKNRSIRADDFKHLALVIKYFGSWKNGLNEVLGISNIKSYTKEEIINLMKEHYKKNGTIKSKDFKHIKLVVKYFGSWAVAVETIFGFKNSQFKYSKKDLIKLIQKHYKENGKILSSTFKQYDQVRKSFGSWEKGVKEALGFYDKKILYTRKIYSKETITEIILKFHKKNNRFPVDIEYGSEKLGLPGKTTINRYFGGLTKMKRAIEEELNRQNKIK